MQDSGLIWFVKSKIHDHYALFMVIGVRFFHTCLSCINNSAIEAICLPKCLTFVYTGTDDTSAITYGPVEGMV